MTESEKRLYLHVKDNLLKVGVRRARNMVMREIPIFFLLYLSSSM